MSAWSALFGHCPNTSPSPAIIHLGPAGRPGGRCRLVFALVVVLLLLLSSMEGAYGAGLPVWASWKLAGRRVRRREAWSVDRYSTWYARSLVTGTTKKARVLRSRRRQDSAGQRI